MEPPQGNGPPQGPQGDDGAPKYVTEEQLNKAISARFGTFEKKIEKSLSGFDVEKLVGSLEERLAAKFTPPPGDKDKAPPGEDPIVKGLQKQLAELKKSHDEREQALTAERTKLRDRDLRQALADELTKQGVDASRVRHAVGLLVDSDKRVRWDDSGETILFRDSDGDVDLSTGLKAWAKSDDAKIYLPPRGTSGSGDRPSGNRPAGQQQGAVTREGVGLMIHDLLTRGGG